MDAFTSKITYDFIRELGEINNTIVDERPQETSNINVELLENVKIWQYQIVQSLKENKNLFIIFLIEEVMVKRLIIQWRNCRKF